MNWSSGLAPASSSSSASSSLAALSGASLSLPRDFELLDPALDAEAALGSSSPVASAWARGSTMFHYPRRHTTATLIMKDRGKHWRLVRLLVLIHFLTFLLFLFLFLFLFLLSLLRLLPVGFRSPLRAPGQKSTPMQPRYTLLLFRPGASSWTAIHIQRAADSDRSLFRSDRLACCAGSGRRVSGCA